MLWPVQFLAMMFCATVLYAAGPQKTKQQPPIPPSQSPPRSADSQDNATSKSDQSSIPQQDAGSYSSSRNNLIDLSPPKDDAKLHPNSAEAVHEAEDAAGLLEGDEIGGIQELHPWDPHKAAKDIEVGDYYFKVKNYRGALDRYQEALYYQNNNALATFKVGECQEKMGDLDDARKAFAAYLKILPEGPLSRQAKEALNRLNAQASDKQNKGGASETPHP
jgi:tetratricopeptide (TPR) repeat protein